MSATALLRTACGFLLLCLVSSFSGCDKEDTEPRGSKCHKPTTTSSDKCHKPTTTTPSDSPNTGGAS